MKGSLITTIPKSITGQEELVVLPRKELERLLRSRVTTEMVLRWSKEAQKLKKAGKLPLLRSLRELR